MASADSKMSAWKGHSLVLHYLCVSCALGIVALKLLVRYLGQWFGLFFPLQSQVWVLQSHLSSSIEVLISHSSDLLAGTQRFLSILHLDKSSHTYLLPEHSHCLSHKASVLTMNI